MFSIFKDAIKRHRDHQEDLHKADKKKKDKDDD